MITTVIIDNERQSRKLLRTMLIDFCDEVIVLGEAKNVKSGIELLQRVKPDIVLLDIEMPDGDGFDILNVFNDADFETIFVTCDDHHAIKAIKYDALDYLLKPIDLEELQLAIKKSELCHFYNNHKLGFLPTQFRKNQNELQQVALPGRNSHTVIEVQSIIRIEAQGSYVIIYVEGGKSHLGMNSLSYYEKLLLNDSFFRIHKSHLINIFKIKSFALGRRKVLLKDDSELSIAARRKSAFSQLINTVYKLQ